MHKHDTEVKQGQVPRTDGRSKRDMKTEKSDRKKPIELTQKLQNKNKCHKQHQSSTNKTN